MWAVPLLCTGSLQNQPFCTTASGLDSVENVEGTYNVIEMERSKQTGRRS